MSSLSIFSIVNSLSGWVVADQTLTCPPAHLVAKYLFLSLSSDTIFITDSVCASLIMSNWFFYSVPRTIKFPYPNEAIIMSFFSPVVDMVFKASCVSMV